MGTKMVAIAQKTLWVTLFLLVYQTAKILGQDNNCDASLGLADSSIPDSSITSSIEGSSPSAARLNGDGAWCFKQSEITLGTKVTLTVDLGRTALVSGFQTQGPPKSIYDAQYFTYIGFTVLNSSSLDGDDWDTCCGGNEVTFYSEDEDGEIDVITTHPLLTLVAARRLRLEFLTDVQWPGEDDKCFRIEILGCPPDVEPKVELGMEAVPAGWVVATWNTPVVLIPGPSGDFLQLTLDATTYIAQMSRSGGGEEDETTESEVAARRFTVASPLWGATYTMDLLCGYHGLNLSCGTDNISAQVTGCDPKQNTCLIQDQVVFRRPLWLQAVVVGEGQVELTWSSDSAGWITPTISLQVTDNDGEEVDEQTLSNKEERVLVTGVTGGNNYSVSFMPQGDSQILATFFFNLHILAWEDVKLSKMETGYGAFVTDVGLAANILWNGTLRVTWTPALVLGASWEESTAAQLVTEVPEVTDVTTDISNTTLFTSVTSNRTDWDNNTETWLNSSNHTDWDNHTETWLNSSNQTDLDTYAETRLSSPTPTPVEYSDATAFMYTIYLTSDGEERADNVTDISGDVIGIDLSVLTFEKQYAVSLTCHFGEVSVQCGSANIYTALPLHWTTVNNETIIHAPAHGLGGWEEQEKQCRLSAGTLVSLANSMEDNRLLEALTSNSIKPTLDTFWLGLNMCPENTGALWSDGSRWQHSRLPSTDAMLSSVSCCIKAVWSPAQRHFTWLGEACDALLPAVCEFHPEGMVGKPESVEIGKANTTEVGITWNFQPTFWNASDMIIEYCPVRNLANIDSLPNVEEDLGNCTVTTVDVNTVEFTQTDLKPFTEYSVSVRATIEAINFTGPPTTTVVYTYPVSPLLVRTLPSGLLHIMWAQKVAEFGEKQNVVLTVTNSTHPESIMTSRTIEAIGFTIDGIALGASYTVSLEELGNKRRKETVTVSAYPACPCDNCQIGGLCYVVSEKQSDGFSAAQHCVAWESKLIAIDNSTQIDLLLQMAEELRDDLWVDPDSMKISATEADLRDTAALLTNEIEIVDDEVAAETQSQKECLMISRSLKAVVVEACSIMHRPACRYKTPVSSAFPLSSAITSQIGGNWISLDWTSDWGWKAQYIVYYQRTKEKRYKRALKEQTFESPPVVISELQLDTSYTIELVADLGEGFISSSSEFELVTSNDSSVATTDKLIVSSVRVGDYQIMQLVCSSLLVAACITTMLLFFATGMFYQDCVAQLAFQGTLMAAFLNLMLAHPNPVEQENEFGCVILGVVLHFLFLCAFMFLMLESLTYAHLLVIQIRSPFQKSNWILMAFGLAVPLIIVAVAAGFTYSEYADFNNSNCWLNGAGSAVYGEAIPILILVIASVFLLLNTIFNTETPPELIDMNLRSRQGDSHKLRWVVLALVLELAVVWSTGVAAYHTQDQALRTAFCVFTLILAITIAGARTTLDDTFRSKMHRLCCGTELTYKRSEVISLSGRSRVGPSPNQSSSAASARLITPVGSKPFVANSPDTPDDYSADSVGVTNFAIKKATLLGPKTSPPAKNRTEAAPGTGSINSLESQKVEDTANASQQQDVDDESVETTDSRGKSPQTMSISSVSPQSVNPRTLSSLSQNTRTTSRQSVGSRSLLPKSPDEVGTLPQNVNAILTPRPSSAKQEKKTVVGNPSQTTTENR